MAEFFENGKIENVLTDRDSHARVTLLGLKDTEWKIFDWKMRIARDFDKSAQRRIHEPLLKQKETKATKDL